MLVRVLTARAAAQLWDGSQAGALSTQQIVDPTRWTPKSGSNKLFDSVDDAVADIFPGATLCVEALACVSACARTVHQWWPSSRH